MLLTDAVSVLANINTANARAWAWNENLVPSSQVRRRGCLKMVVAVVVVVVVGVVGRGTYYVNINDAMGYRKTP